MSTQSIVRFLSLSVLFLVSDGYSQTSSDSLRLTNDRNALLKAIESNSDPYQTAKACQRLAEIGDAQAIEPLSKLLSDPHLSNYARNALEGIPDPKSRIALRKSLSQVQGNLLVGVIGSIGRLRDAEAINELAKLVSADDLSVAEAAGRALAKIGTPQAAEILKSSLRSAPKPLQRAQAVSILEAIQQLFQRGEKASGLEMVDFLIDSDVADEVKLGAAVQAILANGQATPTMLLDQLRSSERADFLSAILAVRQVGGDRESLAQLLADELANLSSDRQATMIRAIADLKSKVALVPIQKLAESGATEVKQEALRLLARQQDSSSLKILFEAAVSKDAALAKAARQGLASWPSEEIDERILKMLIASDTSQIGAAIELSGWRRLAKAAKLLLPFAKGPDVELRVMALEAIGACGTLSEFPTLLDIAKEVPEADSRQAAKEAIRIASVRLPQSGCAKGLDAAISNSTGEARVYFLDQLAAVGGQEALDSIVRAAKSKDAELQDASTRLLGEWLTPDVAPKLLELSKLLTDERLKTRAIRGYIRVARQLDMPQEDRIEICRQTLSLSDRPEELTLVLTVLRQYPSLSGLEVVSRLLETSSANESTCSAGLAIAQKTVATHPNEVKIVLQKIADASKSPETIAACKAILSP